MGKSAKYLQVQIHCHDGYSFQSEIEISLWKSVGALALVEQLVSFSKMSK